LPAGLAAGQAAVPLRSTVFKGKKKQGYCVENLIFGAVAFAEERPGGALQRTAALHCCANFRCERNAQRILLRSGTEYATNK
jgi:hypothetical protein